MYQTLKLKHVGDHNQKQPLTAYSVLPLCIQNPQFLASEVRQSLTFNNLTNSTRRIISDGVHPQPRQTPDARLLVLPPCAQNKPCDALKRKNESTETAWISPAGSTDWSMCAHFRDEDRREEERGREVGGRYEGGQGEEKGERRGMSKKSSESSEEVMNNQKKKKSLVVLTDQSVLRVRPAWHVF